MDIMVRVGAQQGLKNIEKEAGRGIAEDSEESSAATTPASTPRAIAILEDDPDDKSLDLESDG